MNKKTKKALFSLIFVLLLMFVNEYFSETFAYDNKTYVANDVEITSETVLKVHYLDVGQGDSIFIELPNKKTMLIDASISEASETIIDYIEDLNYSKIDYLIATHPHSDHIGGMKDVVNNFNLCLIYMPKVVTTTKTYENLLQAISDKGMKIKTAKAGLNMIDENDLKVEVLAPNKDSYEDLNNYSIVLKITYKDRSFIFMGDAEKLSEDEITGNVESDVIKIGHHGSSSSSSAGFLKRVNPSLAVISVGENNDYNHPTETVLKRLQKNNIKVYRTDLNGNIILTTDGEKIKIEVEKINGSNS